MIKPRIVLSRCFLKPTRYNGSKAFDEFVEKLLNYVDYIDVCPEVDIGLGIPRKNLIIIKENDKKRLIQPETGKDFTELILSYSYETIKKFDFIDGFIFKAKSPSCGVSSAKIYENNKIIGKTSGIFAEIVKLKFPYLPVEDEGRLRNEDIRKHFMIRIFSFAEFRKIFETQKISNLVNFHTKYKFLLLTYNQKILRELGKIIADGKMDVSEKFKKYKELFYKAFIRKPSPKRHINTILHIYGHFSKYLNKEEKKHFINLIEKYKMGIVELQVLVELLRSFALRFGDEYVKIQRYLQPYPEKLEKFRY